MDTLADCMMYHSKTATVENKAELNFAVCVLCDTLCTASLLCTGTLRVFVTRRSDPFTGTVLESVLEPTSKAAFWSLAFPLSL